MTANGGTNVPAKFFLPNRLTPFLTPTPESACDSTVVGTRTTRMPRCAIAAANDAMSSTAPPPTIDHERLAIEADVVDVLQHARARGRCRS